jgi:hypothetical protein
MVLTVSNGPSGGDRKDNLSGLIAEGTVAAMRENHTLNSNIEHILFPFCRPVPSQRCDWVEKSGGQYFPLLNCGVATVSLGYWGQASVVILNSVSVGADVKLRVGPSENSIKVSICEIQKSQFLRYRKCMVANELRRNCAWARWAFEAAYLCHVVVLRWIGSFVAPRNAFNKCRRN